MDIIAIKNDYVTNASLTSQLNDLKSQHIATEVTGIDNKTFFRDPFFIPFSS